tara:strand:- start:1452 stop:2699 length:1248 start_codon:yes stop_codon:yes gene_type:complete
MTISTTTIKNSYSGNGSTSVFNYTFKITDDDHIQVIIRSASGSESVKTKNSHYTVSGVGNAGGGSVTFTAGSFPVSGETVVLRRLTPQTQGLDLIENDPMPAENIETAYDKLTAITQELQEQIDRSIKVSRTTTISNPELTSDATQRAGKLLGFDSNGDLDGTIDGSAVAANATAAAASATAAAGSATSAAASAQQAQNVAGGGTVKITSNDTTLALLNDKIAVGTGITKSTLNSGGNEQLQLAVSGITSAEVYGFNLSYVPSTINYSVAVQSVGGANKYFILGEQQKTLDLFEGNTYVFTYPAAHPIALSTTSDGTHGGGSEYTTGVTRNVAQTTLTYVVPTGAPTLYYYCTNHSGMGGQANTPVPFNNNLQVTTTNSGADDITNAQYAAFDDVIFAASGFTFSLSNGSLIATI